MIDNRKHHSTGMGFSSGQCEVCHQDVPLLASALRVCPACLKRFPGEAWPHVAAAHQLARDGYDLPVQAPHADLGLGCNLCVQECIIPEGEKGFCGLRENRRGVLNVAAGNPSYGRFVSSLNTVGIKCVAGSICPGSKLDGRKSLSVFYGSCTFNCLSCQNWNYRMIPPQKGASADGLAASVDAEVACVCFTGGDPSSQMPHALATARQLVEKGVRVCWETNGSMRPGLLEKAVRMSLTTGGCIKFELRAWDEYLHRAFTGVGNRWILDNFQRAASLMARHSESLLVASTLLIPGYVDTEEIFQLARFIAGVDPQIPYLLLGFNPQFHFGDLPTTSVRAAREATEAARTAGLQNVYLSNEHLLRTH